MVDSGAEDTVAPPNLLPGAVRPSEMSQSGKCYRGANGSEIRNLGQTVCDFQDSSGQECGLGFQIAAVERPLVAVSQLCDNGCEVTFRKTDGVIRHLESGRQTPLVRQRGVYLLKMEVECDRSQPRTPAASGFPRQEKE